MFFLELFLDKSLIKFRNKISNFLISISLIIYSVYFLLNKFLEYLLKYEYGFIFSIIFVFIIGTLAFINITKVRNKKQYEDTKLVDNDVLINFIDGVLKGFKYDEARGKT